MNESFEQPESVLRRGGLARWRWIGILSIVFLISMSSILAQSAAPQILEKGYRVKHYELCGYFNEGKRVQGYREETRLQVLDIECSPGGPWGDYVYLLLSDTLIWDEVYVQRVSFNGRPERFTGVNYEGYWGRLAFAPAGWNRGDVLFASTYISSAAGPQFTGSFIAWIAPDGLHDPRSQHATGNDNSIAGAVVDPSGDFGGDYFFNHATLGILRVDDDGNITPFAMASPGHETRFGPGGGWGTDLYAAGNVISPDGTVTPFPVPFSEFDWAEGVGFNGDMFNLEFGSTPRNVNRIQPDGTKTLFAIVDADNLSFCNGALWFPTDEGCYGVFPTGAAR